MFSCTQPNQNLNPLFSTCQQQPNKFKKIGHFIYHYNYQIGKGTYSQVFQGLNIKTQKQVAIKVIDLATIQSKNLFTLLYQEIELIQELNHPNIIKCFEVKKSQNRFYIVTELCKKENLEVLIDKAKNKKLPINTIEKIILDIIEGLQYLAQKAIIHRDLKSANILFSHSGKAKIADFGFATYSLNQFKDTIFVGTPLYMTPQAVLQQKYSSKTDIWSFGIIFFQLLFGYAPLNNCKTQNQFLTQITKPIQIPQNQYITNSLQELLQGCLQPNSNNRWTILKIIQSQYIQQLHKKYKQTPRYSTPSQKPINQFTLLKKQSTSTNTKDSTNHIQIQSNIITTHKNTKSTTITNHHFQYPKNHQYNHPKIYENNPQNYPQPITPKIKQTFPQKHSKTHPNFQPNPNTYEYHIINHTNPFKIENSTKSNQIFMTQQPPTLIIKQQSLNQAINYINPQPQNIIQKPIFRKTNSIRIEKTNQKITFQNPTNIQNFSFFRGQQITYKQAVSLIHYCRLLNKVLQFPKYHHQYLKKWLIFLIEDLKDNISGKIMKENQISSLKSALNGYHAQYTKSYPDVRPSKSQQFIPQIKNLIKIIQNLQQIDIQNQQKGLHKQLLICLTQQTQNLDKSLSKQIINLQNFQKITKCELYLDWFNNNQKQQNQIIKQSL